MFSHWRSVRSLGYRFRVVVLIASRVTAAGGHGERPISRRPVSGKPETWACGIVRTIGWVNFLDDSSRSRTMKLTAIDKAFGVAESTGQGKSKAIRTMLKIRQFDPDWTLPSRMDDNPMAWMIEVNGLVVDARHVPEGGPGRGVSRRA